MSTEALVEGRELDERSMVRFAELLRLFEQQRERLDYFFEHMDVRQAQQLLGMILDCAGTLFISGVGKSGSVAQKMATTLTSTGTKAQFLSPTDSLHGDLGAVASGDLLIALSKSGESEELLRILPYVKAKGAKTVAIVSKPGSQLSKRCDAQVVLPLERELCPFDLAPTTSAAIQMIFGDVITVALMQAKGFTLDQYAQNHPAGRIGKRMLLRVKDLMVMGEQLPTCSAHDRLIHCLQQFTAKGCGCLLIVDENGVLEGIFTDGDLRRALQMQGPDVVNQTMGTMMTRSPRCTTEDMLAWEAMESMEQEPQRPVYLLPVLKDGLLVGLVRMHDLVQAGL